MRVFALDHLVLNVSDVAASVAWYVEVLGMKPETVQAGGAVPARTSLLFGANKINLRPASTGQDEWFTGRTPQAGSDDLCFLTEAPPEAVVVHLQACGVAVERGPVEKRGARGPIQSVYCRDPDGNLIEISSYPT